LVTITHPHHPLHGQQLPVVFVRHGEHPDVIVCLPDGDHAAIALADTDYAEPSSPHPSPSHLLDLNGLRRMAQLVAALRHKQPASA
jgi:hypothetical protein